MARTGVRVNVALRWLWSLLAIAVLAMSVLYRSISAKPGPATAMVVLASSLLLAATTIQAARIWLALTRRQQAP